LPRRTAPARTSSPIVSNALAAAACLFFAAFAVVRAVRVPLTYDEAATYLKYVSRDALAPFNFAYATNHFLNSLLARLFSRILGRSDMVLRLPSLLGYGMYLSGSLLILRRLADRVVAFGGLLLLNLNPYLLDYFSLSRGYGLSLGFLMGALLFLFRFVGTLSTGTVDGRLLSLALLFAAGAVMANFAMLNVYVSVFAVGLVACVAANASRTRPSGPPDSAPAGGRRFPWLPVAAAGFTLLVFSQDVGLSPHLYEPVVVRLVGLGEPALAGASVIGIDIRGQETAFLRHADAWRQARPAHLTGLRVELPVAAANGLAGIDVVAGNRPFWSDQRSLLWNSREGDGTRVLESVAALSLPKSRMPAFRPIINWGGDTRYLAYLAAHTAVAMLLLGIVALLLRAAGWAAHRTGLVTRDQWRRLASSALWVVALAGGPLYLLRRDGELYFGGTDGLITDTFQSLVRNSFYGRVYSADQMTMALGGVALSVLTFVAVAAVHYRRRTIRPLLPGLCLLTIMALVALATTVQHLAWQTPYLTGRTALFYIPLYVLFATFLCGAMAELGQSGLWFARAVMALSVAFALHHFATTANVQYTWDWPRDAGTKAMIGDLEQLVARAPSAGPHPTLGVYWEFWPVAEVYAERGAGPRLDVIAEPSPRSVDFLYVHDDAQPPGMHVIRTYPVAGSVLVGTR
jgi:hypothetical protein